MLFILFLAITGILLWCIEIFVPGGILGILGTLCLLAACISTYSIYGARKGMLSFVVLLVACSGTMLLWFWLFPKSRFGRRMVNRYDLAESHTSDTHSELVGKTGTAVTPLRPAGTAEIGTNRVDVVAESGLIAAGSSIKVLAVEGSRVVVRKL